MKAVRCTAKSSCTAAKLLAAIAVSSAALCASAATYYWKPGTTQGLWTDLSNWSTESVAGAAAGSLPGSSDELYGQGSYNFLLGGQSYAVKKCYNDTDSTGNYSIALENGTLEFTSELRCIKGSVDINNAATLRIPVNSTIYTGLYRGAEEENRFPVNINFGGSMEVLGTARFFNTKYSVANGGTLTFSPSTLRISTQSYACRTGIENNGTLNLPNGLSMKTFDGASATGGASFTIWQNSGTMTLGGPITKNNQPGTFNVDFVGGTVNVTGNASFDVSSAQVSGPVTFNVAEGKTLNTTSLEIVDEGVLTKTGPGYIAFPATAQTVTVSEGGVALDSGTYNLSAVTFAANTAVRIATFGGTINQGGYPASLSENATFTADLSSASAGTTIFNSDDAVLLEKIKTDLATSVPQGLEFVVSGTQLMLETATSDADTFTVTGNITEGTGWGGSVPGGGANVAISGEGVVGTLPSSASFPAWASIEVKNGATLRVEATATLPPITLNKNARLEIGNNATVTLANASDLSGVVNVLGDVITIPGLSVESGATLNVPGGMKFSNVNISLSGTIASISTGGITFGYANGGESTYIGFTASSGSVLKIFEGTSVSYGLDPLEFCCPAAGGSVIPRGTMTLTNVSLTKNSGYDYSTGHCHGFHLGVNNPANIPFEVVFDNTTWGVGGKVKIQGGAKFSLRNNGAFVNYEHHTAWDRHFDISENGQIVVGNGCELRVNALGNYGATPTTVNPTTDGYTAITVEEGGVFEVYTTSGNGNGVVSIAGDARWTVFEPYIVNNDEVKSTCIPFYGLDSVDVALNATFTFTTRNRKFSWTPTVVDDLGADRVVSLANVPITGGGSIALSNDNVNVFGVIVTCGENTATGTAKVIPPASGKGETTLYFADGANWAGTVTAGNVALTNLVDSAAACTNTFGTLDLAAGTTFPIRVWKTGGVIVAHDGLNVGSYAYSGGKIVLVAMDEELAPGDSFILGTVGDDSKPAVGGKWESRSENGILKVKYSSGLTVILR